MADKETTDTNIEEQQSIKKEEASNNSDESSNKKEDEASSNNEESSSNSDESSSKKEEAAPLKEEAPKQPVVNHPTFKEKHHRKHKNTPASYSMQNPKAWSGRRFSETAGIFLSGVLISFAVCALSLVLFMAAVFILLNQSGALNLLFGYSYDSRFDDEDLWTKFGVIRAYTEEFFALERPSQEQLYDSMYNGYLEGYGDKYTFYYTKENYAALLEDSSGVYGGVGATMTQDADTGSVIITQLNSIESPAAEAGIKVGDSIIGVYQIETGEAKRQISNGEVDNINKNKYSNDSDDTDNGTDEDDDKSNLFLNNKNTSENQESSTQQADDSFINWEYTSDNSGNQIKYFWLGTSKSEYSNNDDSASSSPVQIPPLGQTSIEDEEDNTVGIKDLEEEDIKELTLSELVKYIKGEAGTYVKIKIYRESTDEELIFIVERRNIEIELVSSELIDIQSDENEEQQAVAYISLTEFEGGAADKIKEHFTNIQNQCEEENKELLGVILDLRDNPGGLVDEAVDIADMFLPKCTIVTVRRNDGSENIYRAKDNNIMNIQGSSIFSSEKGEQLQLVILVNGGSASASEMLSGAIQDNGYGVIMGEQTFGKGIAQMVIDLKDGTAMQLTSALYYLPNGSNIHEVGITPDIIVEDDLETEEDEQLESAISWFMSNR